MGRSMLEVVSPYERVSGRRVLLTTVFVSVAVVLALLLQSAGIDGAFGDSGHPSEATMATEYPLTPPDPAAEPAPSALYAGVMWSVLGTDVTPGEGFLHPATVTVHLRLQNTLTLTAVRVADSLLTLTSTAGPLVTDALFTDAGRRVTLEPGQGREVSAAFTVTSMANPDPATLSLQIAEPSHVPAWIPLTTRPPAAPTAIRIDIDRSPVALPDPDRAGRQIVATPAGASLGIDAGPLRALATDHLFVIKVNLQRASINADSTFLTPAYWALQSSAGTSQAMLVAPGSKVGSNANELTLVFDVPVDAQQLQLVAAAGRPEATAIALSIPAES